MQFTHKFCTHRRSLIIVLHCALTAISSYCALWLRFDGIIPEPQLYGWYRLLPWLVLIRAGVFLPFQLYEGFWRYTGIWDLRSIALGVITSSGLFSLLAYVNDGWVGYPRSVLIIDTMLLVCFMGSLRLLVRAYRTISSGHPKKRVLVYGAGDVGETIVRDMKNDGNLGYQPIGFIDDDPMKVGIFIHGIRVFGTRYDLPQIIASQDVDEVIVAMAHRTPSVMRDIVKRLEPFKIPISTVPRYQDILDGTVTINQIREVETADLLLRRSVDLDIKPVRDLLTNKCVLVTGAGGSIGSEIARQVAALNPKCLILFERHENSLYLITNDLANRTHSQSGETKVLSMLGDITDADRVQSVFSDYQPHIVFHAAAHKHVPLVEENASEAVKNNIFGTQIMMKAADWHKTERFVLISSDKAVSPSSVMGATKRVGEMLLQITTSRSATRFMTVRFGNVIGSSGSVVPHFLEQIKQGGPVTVTHPDMRRYFMFITEAVQLVLHAAALGHHQTLFVLEMGEQIKILDLARTIIRLSGYVPEVDIPITCVGIRPGEKLCEQLIEPDEKIEPSAIETIMQVHPGQLPSERYFASKMLELEKLALQNQNEAILVCLQKMVPTFQPVKPIESVEPEASKLAS